MTPLAGQVDLQGFLSRERDRTEAALEEALERILPRVPAELAGALRHGVTSAGKRLRPILCVAAYRAVGGIGEAVYGLAVSLELIHAYSLMHDDLPCMDDADLRRGKPTTHRVEGERATMVAGALLIPVAARQAWEGGMAMGLPEERCRLLLEELSRAAGGGGMVGGQFLDLLGEETTLTAPELDDLHRRKTGALLRASLRMGAIAGAATPEELEALGPLRRGHRSRVPDRRRPSRRHVVGPGPGQEPVGRRAGQVHLRHAVRGGRGFQKSPGARPASGVGPPGGRVGGSGAGGAGLVCGGAGAIEKGITRGAVATVFAYLLWLDSFSKEAVEVPLLDRVKYPEDLRGLSREELHELVNEARERHIDVVSKVGGHFGASLGVAELTVALHYIFETPRDKIVWDTGHQAYIHKILTGRNDLLPTIRQKDGLAPFCRRDESEYDAFGAGHAATSISAAWGMAVARDLKEEDFRVVAVIGDGAMGCGLAYEALNNAGHTGRDFIVVLNDNEMSIAPNVGAMSKYLTSMITNPAYNRVRQEVKGLLQRVPTGLGEIMEHVAYKVEEGVKNIFLPGMLFQELGFPVCGSRGGAQPGRAVGHPGWGEGDAGAHPRACPDPEGEGVRCSRVGSLQVACRQALRQGIRNLHGRGIEALPAYQKVFGRGLVELGESDRRVVAITAGMRDGTSTDLFAEAYPDRFFDVGIAEGHGVTFAAGLASEGMRPVVAVYSTFLQRGFDGIVHDVALQNLPVVFAMDRAGVAGADGATHHGVLDINYMLSVPGMTVTAPKDGSELLALLRLGVRHEGGPFSLRWPRDNVPGPVPTLAGIPELAYGSWEVVREGKDLAILAVGTMVLEALKAAEELSQDGIDLTVVNCRFLKPFDTAVLKQVLAAHTKS
jgi:1-deoxy-D-xylulose-5-phosphate synthase